jgi:hypothetical protein
MKTCQNFSPTHREIDFTALGHSLNGSKNNVLHYFYCSATHSMVECRVYKDHCISFVFCYNEITEVGFFTEKRGLFSSQFRWFMADGISLERVPGEIKW